MIEPIRFIAELTVHDEANRGSTWADLTRKPLRGEWHA
jgi:hypothetical protein